MNEISMVASYGTLAGGWAWHFLSPPHQEHYSLHSHRTVEMYGTLQQTREMTAILRAAGYQYIRMTGPGGDFQRFEKYIQDACPRCFERNLVTKSTEHGRCSSCELRVELAQHGFTRYKGAPAVKAVFDVFLKEAPTIVIRNYTLVDPKEIQDLGYFAAQAAAKLDPENRIRHPDLVGPFGLKAESVISLGVSVSSGIHLGHVYFPGTPILDLQPQGSQWLAEVASPSGRARETLTLEDDDLEVS